MNIIQGPGRQIADQDEARAMRIHAISLALEWSRSAGQEHCTRVPIDDFINAARKIEIYIKGEKQ